MAGETIDLPNEIWLHIASYCPPRDLWLGMRPINRQLKQCAEQYFTDRWLSRIHLALPITLPTYDVRSPIRARAVFRPECARTTDVLSADADDERAIYVLTQTEPEHYQIHFLDRWEAMCDANERGALKEKLIWEMSLGERKVAAKLRRPCGVVGHGTTSDSRARLSFEWRASVTGFFR